MSESMIEQLRAAGWQVMVQYRLRCEDCDHAMTVPGSALRHYGIEYVEPNTGHKMVAEMRARIQMTDWAPVDDVPESASEDGAA